jgi:hypothetical protein
MSCKTHEQLDSASNWIDNTKLLGSGIAAYYTWKDLKKAITEQRLYLNRLKELEV